MGSSQEEESSREEDGCSRVEQRPIPQSPPPGEIHLVVNQADYLSPILSNVVQPVVEGDISFAETTHMDDRLLLNDYDRKIACEERTQSVFHEKNTEDIVGKEWNPPPCNGDLRDHDNIISQSPMLVAPKETSHGVSSSIPLSQATSCDSLVHNDILKVIMIGDSSVDKTAVARSLRKLDRLRTKRAMWGVNVRSWNPDPHGRVKFSIWDVQGANMTTDSYSIVDDTSTPNCGSHPETQSLFFSDNGLFILVWDLAANNPKTFHSVNCRTEGEDANNDDSYCDSECSEEGQHDNEYVTEEANRLADRTLQRDIGERVLRWVDAVAKGGSRSAILPVALVPVNMSSIETKRRCDAMQKSLQDYSYRKIASLSQDLCFPPPPKFLYEAEHSVLCVSLENNLGMDALEQKILAVATRGSHPVFDHVNTMVPKGTMSLLEAVRRLRKQEYAIVLVDLLRAEMSEKLNAVELMSALYFLSSVGKVLYFGDRAEALSRYVILSQSWLVSALSCIIRPDWKRELVRTRRLYSDATLPESHVIQTFTAGSNCPLLSSCDMHVLWQSRNFMRVQADRIKDELSENSTAVPTMLSFLEHLFAQTGVFVPVNFDRGFDNICFVPSLLSGPVSDVWSFKTSEAWMTTLSHTWLFQDGVPGGLMEQVTVRLLQDLYEFSQSVFHTARPEGLIASEKSSQFPFVEDSMTDSLEESIVDINIQQVLCWKNSLLVLVDCVFRDGDNLWKSTAEMFVAVADEASPQCVDSDAMKSDLPRLVASGKGPIGHHGRRLWEGGYRVVLDSIKASVAHCTNVDREVVCPECLAHTHPNKASTWNWDRVCAKSLGNSSERCVRGHRVDLNLMCGTATPTQRKQGEQSLHLWRKSVKDMLPAVVIVGLWDTETKAVQNIGSGFMLEGGLVITAGHILFDKTKEHNFGTPYGGLKHGKAIVGVIPGGEKMMSTEHRAVFRYFAEIVAEDIHHVDACVLKIVARMEKDIVGAKLANTEADSLFDDTAQFPTLKMTSRYEIDECVRLLGFNQGGEGILEQGKHINRSAEVARGSICKQFKVDADEFARREEVVVSCSTICGHSGGPFVNDDGEVVGILSRADTVERDRCYLVPVTELRRLVSHVRPADRRCAS